MLVEPGANRGKRCRYEEADGATMFDSFMTCRILLVALALALAAPLSATVADAQHGRRDRQRRTDNSARHRAAQQAYPVVHAKASPAAGGDRRADRRKAQDTRGQAMATRCLRYRRRQRPCQHGGPHATYARAIDRTTGALRHQHCHPQAPDSGRYRLAATSARTLPVQPADRRKGNTHGHGSQNRR